MAGIRVRARILAVLLLGSLPGACGTYDCLDGCQDLLALCTGNCDRAHPARGTDWHACASTCDMEDVACENRCIQAAPPRTVE